MPHRSGNGKYHKDTCAYAGLSSYEYVSKLPENAEYSACSACDTLL